MNCYQTPGYVFPTYFHGTEHDAYVPDFIVLFLLRPLLSSGCKCNPIGSTKYLCESNATCVCKAGYTGPSCDSCVDDRHHYFSSTGCKRTCDC